MAGRKTIYVGSLYEEQVQAGVTTRIHYIQAGGLPVAIYRNFSDNATPETRYLHRDHLGSVTEITDESGALVESLAYDPHGKRRETDWKDALTPVTALETARSFTHHEYLDEVSLIHMNGRVYDPDLGRFLSADPFIQFPEYSQSFNRYSYVLNNPLSFVDPSGYGIFGDIFDFIGDVFDAFVDVAKGFLDAVVNYFSPEAILGRLLTVAAALACGPAGPVCAATVAGGYTAATGGGITDILLAAVTAYNGVAGVEAQIPQEFVTGLKVGYVIDKFVNNRGDGTPGEGQTLEDTGNIVAQASGGGSLDEYGGGKFANAAEIALQYALGAGDAYAADLSQSNLEKATKLLKAGNALFLIKDINNLGELSNAAGSIQWKIIDKLNLGTDAEVREIAKLAGVDPTLPRVAIGALVSSRTATNLQNLHRGLLVTAVSMGAREVIAIPISYGPKLIEFGLEASGFATNVLSPEHRMPSQGEIRSFLLSQ